MQPIRMTIVWEVLEMAKDAKDEHVVYASSSLRKIDLGGAPAPRSTGELLSLSSQAKSLWLEHLGEIR